MLKVFINGLYYNEKISSGVEVVIYDLLTSDESYGSIIFQKESNNEGVVEGSIDKSFLNCEILIVICAPGFRYQTIKSKVQEYGLFVTINLEYDRNYIGHKSIIHSEADWNRSLEYSKALSTLGNKIRQFKFKNTLIKVIHYILAFVSIFISQIFPPSFSYYLAILFFLLAESFGPYLAGMKPFFRR